MKKIIIIVCLVLFAMMVIIGSIVGDDKKPKTPTDDTYMGKVTPLPSGVVADVNEPDDTSKKDDEIGDGTIVVDAPKEDYGDDENADSEKYDISLGLEGNKNDDGRIAVRTPDPTPTPSNKKIQKKPKYETSVKIFDHTVVPKRNVDGSSCKAYLDSVTLNNFGTYWGTSLTKNDFRGGRFYMVGVEQNSEDYIKAVDLQSTGWLVNNLSKMKASDAIKFTNLHVIGQMSASHVALLCSYDWYSVFGLKDTLVVFEDISKTLKTSDFKDGDIFSATVYAHNIKVMHVNGFNVVVLQYNTFGSWKNYQ